ncbi:TIGR02530 family flagellar biosynthesis protein [Aciduricibacillus chroicocephali]|uniref:TIGR02530 family flagellar biosynthesis protein n=1 Tax=Aciduricibacillus chroicocephali TaxID=3054939 RepID=A0ABY9KYD5_9BACI|nr:TIGR02530 family flagellar biosynthesis protein [Bacillaceae bacterium 44XB]
MDLRMQQIVGTQELQKKSLLPSKPKKNQVVGKFAEILSNAEKPKISKHAELRMKERNIRFDEKKWDEIASKMKEAKAKGVTDSLVLTDNAALIASVKNHTIITAMDRSEADSQVFTNINGTIVMK